MEFDRLQLGDRFYICIDFIEFVSNYVRLQKGEDEKKTI